jgi:hypothetical protein
VAVTLLTTRRWRSGRRPQMEDLFFFSFLLEGSRLHSENCLLSMHGTRDGPDLGSSRTLERYHASTSNQSARRTQSLSQNAAFQHSISDEFSRSSSNSLLRASNFASRADSREVPRRSERSSSFQRVGTGTASSRSLTYSVQGFGRPAWSLLSEERTRWTRRNNRMS